MSLDLRIVIGLLALAALALLFWWRSWRKAPVAGAPAVPVAQAASEETLEHLRHHARYLVWAGFHDRAEILEIVPEVLDESVEKSVIASVVDREFERKRAAQSGWPERTDCDRLDEAFEALNSRGIMALQYAGYTQSDAHGDIAEALAAAAAEGRDDYIGYCFFTAQDVEGLLDGSRELYLGFGTNLEQASEAEQARGAPNNVGAVEAGQLICAVLKEFGFATSWDGTPVNRIAVVGFDWKRRG